MTLRKSLKKWYRRLVGEVRRLRGQVRDAWPGADPLSGSSKEAIYVHYDRRGVVHDYVINQLKELVASEFRITFVSNSPRIMKSKFEDVAPFCRQIIWRRNVGYDFGAYKDGIAAIGDISNITQLLLMNDSVYGPFSQLKQIFADINKSNIDFWGITDSWEHHYHIQSYFLLFFEGALRSTIFRNFWKRLPYVNSKEWMIANGETRLTQLLTQHKLRADVLAPYWSVAKVILQRLEDRDDDDLPGPHRDYLTHLHNQLVLGRPLNASHYFWEVLICDFNCPFIKRELIRVNPMDVPYYWRWSEVIGRTSTYNLEYIWRHLQSS
jgi:lipopolysaccharide biosynthesis protein